MAWEVVIGLETHAQLTTASKIFSGASTAFGAEPNSQASVIDVALPGTLPVLNRAAVERAIRFGLAIGATIAPRSVFARKNYFYPDLPKGYQISQYEIPVVQGGSLSFVVQPKGGDAYMKTRAADARASRGGCGQVAARGMGSHAALGHGMSGIDLNRAGTPLLEIVSEPDIRVASISGAAAEAVAYAKALHSLVVWLGICDGNMQEGSFRCDANVSVRPLGSRRTRHALRDQEPEQLPLHAAGDRVRGATPDRADRGRRHRGAGNAPVRPGPRRNSLACAARKTRWTIATSPTRTCCRSRSHRSGSSACAANCRSCPARCASASCASTDLSEYDAQTLTASKALAYLLRGGGHGAFPTRKSPPTG